ncbi:MAG: 6,7-dimethyl-8-ribityllumazine synthase [Prevotellaceae bacterium]|nr:6,7-dimethyl-8-ribityllumazine synthase [Prevotellaceae bacterium]
MNTLEQVSLNAGVPDASEMRFGIVVAEWNDGINSRLLKQALDTLHEFGAGEQSVTVKHVPGAFELVFGANQLAQHGFVDAIIVIGTVIRGDTPHFDYICQGVTNGISMLNAEGKIPCVFGVLTVENKAQAEERAETKGREFAITAIKMVDYAWQLQK